MVVFEVRVALLGTLALAACEAPSEPASLTSLAPAPSSAVVAAPSVPDSAALAEIVAAAPSGSPATTAPDGGTLVGSETGVDAADAGVEPEPSPDHAAQVRADGMILQQPLSSPAIERAAREQIYWRLGQVCHAADGGVPKPDSVKLSFAIRVDGTIDPASVRAGAIEPGSEALAECVLREFAALPFRGPAAVRGSTALVEITWPSVD